MIQAVEKGVWRCHTTLRKYDVDLADLVRDFGPDRGQAMFEEIVKPVETREIEGNLLVTAGLTILMQLLTGAGGTAYNNANARIGVGDSSTAAAIGQQDLQAATNKLRKAMDATYPTLSAGTATFKSSFTGAEANWAWNEWAVFNSATANTGMLNRKVESLGTKSSGTWTLEVAITIA